MSGACRCRHAAYIAGDALQTFRDYEQRLKTRLGITPNPEIHALITARADRGQA